MRRLFALPVIVPPASAAGLYVASFVYRLLTHLSFFVASVGLIVLFLLGIVSRNTPEEAYAPLLLVERARASETAMYAAGWLGALLVLATIAAVVAKGPEDSSWRRARWAGAVVAVLAVFAGGADLYYGVTPYVERIMPHSSMAATERRVPIVGTAVNGQVSADVGHVALAGTPIQ